MGSVAPYKNRSRDMAVGFCVTLAFIIVFVSLMINHATSQSIPCGSNSVPQSIPRKPAPKSVLVRDTATPRLSPAPLSPDQAPEPPLPHCCGPECRAYPTEKLSVDARLRNLEGRQQYDRNRQESLERHLGLEHTPGRGSGPESHEWAAFDPESLKPNYRGGILKLAPQGTIYDDKGLPTTGTSLVVKPAEQSGLNDDDIPAPSLDPLQVVTEQTIDYPLTNGQYVQKIKVLVLVDEVTGNRFFLHDSRVKLTPANATE